MGAQEQRVIGLDRRARGEAGVDLPRGAETMAFDVDGVRTSRPLRVWRRFCVAWMLLVAAKAGHGQVAPCGADVQLSNSTILSNTPLTALPTSPNFDALNYISASNGFNINVTGQGVAGGSANVTFQAGTAVCLGAGFHAVGTAAGGRFHAWVGNVPPIISTATVPPGTVGAPYSTSLGAVGGTLPYGSWTVTSGVLPPGLVLSASGVISGTPTAAAGSPYGFQVTVTDSHGLVSLPANLSAVIVSPPSGVTEFIRLNGQLLAMEVNSTSGTLADTGILVSPLSTVMVPGGSQTFTATRNGSPVTSATWSTASGGPGPGGPTFSYTAPAGRTIDTVTAADSTGPGTPATVRISPLVSLNSSTAPLEQSQAFMVINNANTPVNWGLQGNGRLATSGPSTSVIFTAPDSVKSSQTSTVVGVDPANPLNRASVALALKPPTLTVTGLTQTTATVGTEFAASFSATDSAKFGRPNTYMYLVLGSGAGPYLNLNAISAGGGLSPAAQLGAASQACILQYNPLSNMLAVADIGGRFTQAGTPGTAGVLESPFCAVNLAGSSKAVGTNDASINAKVTLLEFSGPQNVWTNLFDNDNQTGWVSQGMLTVTRPPVTISPSGPVTLQGGQQQVFDAGQTVIWCLESGPGTIAGAVVVSGGKLCTTSPGYNQATYIAPAATATIQTAVISATASGVSGAAPVLVTIIIPALPPLVLSQSVVSLSTASGPLQVYVTSGGDNSKVNWSIAPATGLLSTMPPTQPGTTIIGSSYVNYTVPAVINGAQTVTLTATDSLHTGRSAAVTIFLTPVSVSINPQGLLMAAGTTSSDYPGGIFTAAVTSAPVTTVSWSLSNPFGFVTPIGNSAVYTAGAPVGGYFIYPGLTATSTFDANAHDSVQNLSVYAPRMVSGTYDPNSGTLTATFRGWGVVGS